MKRRSLSVVCVVIGSILCVVFSAKADSLSVSSTTSGDSWTQNSFYQTYLADRLEVGLRVGYYNFTDGEKKIYDANGTFIGGFTEGISTYQLNEEQSYLPYPYVRYNFIPYLALETGWIKMEGKTWTFGSTPHTDGTLVLSGPTLELIGRYPNETIFTPYAGIGFAYLFADFQEDSAWHAGGLRNMVSDDTMGLMLSAGCSIAIMEHLEAELSVDYVQAQSSTRYWMRGDERDRATWDYPADSIFFRAGVKYCF